MQPWDFYVKIGLIAPGAHKFENSNYNGKTSAGAKKNESGSAPNSFAYNLILFLPHGHFKIAA